MPYVPLMNKNRSIEDNRNDQPEPSVDSVIQGDKGERITEFEERLYCIMKLKILLFLFDVFFRSFRTK